jgi:hypothetical protein
MFLGLFKPFRFFTKVGAKLAELVPLTHKFTKSTCVGIFHNEQTDPLHWNENMFWGPFEPFRYCTKVGAKRAEVVRLTKCSLKEVASEFFATNAPDPLDWTQNSYFGGVSSRFFAAQKSMQNRLNWCY